MGRLVYSMITSLDGFVSDRDGGFGWAEPDAEVHTFINRLERSVETYLYGRRMYQMMAVWETEPALAGASPVARDFAQVWQAADKVVFSTTLTSVATTKTRLERTFDPVRVQAIKAATARDVTVAGPTLAAQAIGAGLVDEYQVFVVPVLVGGGTPLFPADVREDLELVDDHRFTSGVTYLRYQARR